MKRLEKARVMSNREIRPGIFSMWLRSPSISRDARPGQFLHVRVKAQWQPLLRRPLSIGRVKDDQLELVWRVIGEGTARFAELEPGDDVSLLGPLGIPFTVPESLQHAILVGGGLGLPPLVYLHDLLQERGIDSQLLLGVRGDDDIPLAQDDAVLAQTTVVAEAGGRWRAGLVTEPALELLDQLAGQAALSKTALYTCGPWGLVAALQLALPREQLALTEVSLEQQMGCAVGVCQGCAVRAEGGPTPYRLVCHDGPVFDLFGVEVPHAR